MKTLVRFLTPVLLLLLSTACASAPATTDEAVTRLIEARSTFEGARSLANVRITGKGGQSFRASIAIDGLGNMSMSALTPFGTTAAQVRVDGHTVTLINHLRDSYWQGPIESLSGTHALAEALRIEGLPFLVVGLPPWGSNDRVTTTAVGDGLVRLTRDDLSLIASRSGLLSGRIGSGQDEVTVRFESPGMPPSKLQVSSSIDPTRIVQFDHVDLDFEAVVLDPISIPADYRRADSWESVVQ